MGDLNKIHRLNCVDSKERFASKIHADRYERKWDGHPFAKLCNYHHNSIVEGKEFLLCKYQSAWTFSKHCGTWSQEVLIRQFLSTLSNQEGLQWVELRIHMLKPLWDWHHSLSSLHSTTPCPPTKTYTRRPCPCSYFSSIQKNNSLSGESNPLDSHTCSGIVS